MEWEVNGKILTRFISERDFIFVVIPCFGVYLLFLALGQMNTTFRLFTACVILWCWYGLLFMNTVHHFGALISSQHGAQE